MNLDFVGAALVATLEADSELVSTLAPHPDLPSLPAIFYGAKVDFGAVYPCLTYRFGNIRQLPFSRPTAAEGGGEATYYDLPVEIEAWSQAQSALSTLTTRLVAVLDGQVISLPEGGRIYQSTLAPVVPSDYSKDYKVWFALFRGWLRVKQPA